MSSEYFPTYSTFRNKVIDVRLNLSGYVTQKEFKNLTGDINTSDFALKSNVSEINARIDNIDVDKTNIQDQLQGKNFVEDSCLFFEPEYRYIETTKTNGVLSWKSTGLSDEKIKAPKDNYSPQLSF